MMSLVRLTIGVPKSGVHPFSGGKHISRSNEQRSISSLGTVTLCGATPAAAAIETNHATAKTKPFTWLVSDIEGRIVESK